MKQKQKEEGTDNKQNNLPQQESNNNSSQLQNGWTGGNETGLKNSSTKLNNHSANSSVPHVAKKSVRL